MKRNEVLGAIYNILYENTNESESNMENLSNAILDKLEMLGMLPPERESSMDRHYENTWES